MEREMIPPALIPVAFAVALVAIIAFNLVAGYYEGRETSRHEAEINKILEEK